MFRSSQVFAWLSLVNSASAQFSMVASTSREQKPLLILWVLAASELLSWRWQVSMAGFKRKWVL